MKKSCRECDHHNPKMVEKVDGQWKHPFTCICAGPSGSGKSTLVKKLILSQGKIIDSFFNYIIIVIGTEASENKILSSIVKEIPLGRTDVHIMELNKLYPTRRDMVEEFPKQLKKILINRNRKEHEGCIIFDDLMKELGEMGILLDLFTKMSSHYSLSVFHITQNLFHKGAGKHSSDHVGIYWNSKITILFHNPLNNNPLWTVANRLVRKGSGELCNMQEHITEKHRYVVIHGGMEWPKKLCFMTDLFGSTPKGIIRQRVFEFIPQGKSAGRTSFD